MTLVPDRLGSRLKAEREARGLPLEQVAASTKIPLTLLEALERNDLSRWPKGLYRRAFFRSYVSALGLRPDPLAAEFARLFPDDGDAPRPHLRPPGPAAAPAVAPAPAARAPLAITFGTRTAAQGVWRALLLAVAETGGVVAAGTLVAWAAGLSLLSGSGAVALVYYPLTRVAAGRLRLRRPTAAARRTPPVPARPILPVNAAGTVATVAAEAPRAAADTPLPAVQSRLRSTSVRIGHAYGQVSGRWLPASRKAVRSVTGPAWHAAARAGRMLKNGAIQSGRVSASAAGSAAAFVRREGTRVARASALAADWAGRASARVARSSNYAFWRGVRAVSEYAQLMAARQLNRTKE